MDENTLVEKIKRYSNSSTALTSLATKHFLSSNLTPQEVVNRLGSLRGPLMKVGQLLAMVPDILPEPYAKALSSLQSQAPPMGGLFVKRRMKAELGSEWERHFRSFNLEPFAAASIGQVHKAISLKGESLACKLQYPNMYGIIEADLTQFRILLSLYEKGGGAFKTQQFLEEVQTHLYEEISYKKEVHNIGRFQSLFEKESTVSVPQVFPSLSTDRLLTMSYMEGLSLEAFIEKPQDLRNEAAKNLFFAWYYPLYKSGDLHGDPHAGNYFFSETGQISLLDFGCVRHFPKSFLKGVLNLYDALKNHNNDLLIASYEQWGFKNITKSMAETLTLWASHLYAPLLDNRMRPISESYSGEEGKRIATQVLNELKRQGKIELPREFVLMHRVAVGMGAAFIKLRAQLNWHQLFEETLNRAGAFGHEDGYISQDIQNHINHDKRD